MFRKVSEILRVENAKKVVQCHGIFSKSLDFHIQSVEISKKSSSQDIEYFLSKFFLKICYDLSLCENNILKKIPENSFLPVQQLYSMEKMVWAMLQMFTTSKNISTFFRYRYFPRLLSTYLESVSWSYIIIVLCCFILEARKVTTI